MTCNKDESSFEYSVSILCLKLFVNAFTCFFFAKKPKANKKKKSYQMN
jgi:hypothetical protein